MNDSKSVHTRGDVVVEVQLAVALLRGSEFEIEASTLEAVAEDLGASEVDAAISNARTSEKRGGAFGIEMLGAVVVPVVVEAVRQFWAAYHKELMSKLGVSAANATIAQLKQWFLKAPASETEEATRALARKIREIGSQRGLSGQDIDALVLGTAPDRLGAALIDRS